MTALSTAASQLYEFITKGEHGVTNQQIEQEFRVPSERTATALNELLEQHRAVVFKGNENELVYKAVDEAIAVKLERITPEGKMAYETIQAAGNQGIWTRTIKEKCNIAQNTLNRCLKDLESRRLIKTMRSLASKTKKLYVLFDTEPDRAVTGGPWYSDQEFDHEYVSELSNFIVKVIAKQGCHQMMDIKTIADRVAFSGISRVDLTMQDVQLLVNTLVYDGRLEEINSSVLQLSGYAVGKKVYKVSKMTDTPDYLTAAPCGVCPVRHQCHDGGLVSPQTCVYLDDWLDDGDNEYLVDRKPGNDLLEDMNGERDLGKKLWDW